MTGLTLIREHVEQCDHLHDTTTRYDHERKLLHFLRICPSCDIETVIETQPYEPRPVSAGGSVHRLPVRRHERPLRHAA